MGEEMPVVFYAIALIADGRIIVPLQLIGGISRQSCITKLALQHKASIGEREVVAFGFEVKAL